MVRRIGKVDANQADITKALRRAGASVAVLSPMGNGIPDLLVGIAGKNLLFEIKNGDLCPSQQKLTEKEQLFFDNWNGQVCTVNSVKHALELIEFVTATTCF